MCFDGEPSPKDFFEGEAHGQPVVSALCASLFCFKQT